MSNNSDIDLRSELFQSFCQQFPNLKTQVIKQAVVKFNCNPESINNYLRHASQIDVSKCLDDNTSSNTDNSNNQDRTYSFASAVSDISDDSSKYSPGHKYRPSRELSKLSAQNSDLKKLEDAFKQLETTRDFLKMEKENLKIIRRHRSLNKDFPNASDLEGLECRLTRKPAMGPKSLSYANDLRQPAEMNHRFRGFNQGSNNNSTFANNPLEAHDLYQDQNNSHFTIGANSDIPFNNNSHSDNAMSQLNNNNSSAQCLAPTQYILENSLLYKDKQHPNVYHSAFPIDKYVINNKMPSQQLNPNLFKVSQDGRTEEKRFSSHYPQGLDTRNFGGHQRHSSFDSWYELPPVENWTCPQCNVYNIDPICTFCQHIRQ